MSNSVLEGIFSMLQNIQKQTTQNTQTLNDLRQTLPMSQTTSQHQEKETTILQEKSNDIDGLFTNLETKQFQVQRQKKILIKYQQNSKSSFCYLNAAVFVSL